MSKAASKSAWTRVAFGDVVERVDETGVPNADESRIYIGLEHLDGDSFTVTRWGSAVALVVPKTRIKKGDVLFARRNTHLKRCAAAPFDTYFSPDGYAFRSKSPALQQDFLLYIVARDDFMAFAIEHSAGTHSKRVKWADLVRYEFALPPLEEQQRWVRALKAVQDAENALVGLCTSLERTVSALSEEFFSSFSGAASTVADLSVLVTKGASPRWQGFEYSNAGIPFITSENVLAGALTLEAVKFIPQEFHTKLKRSQMVPGDVLLNIVGASIGRAAVVPDDVPVANTNQAVAVVRFDSSRMHGPFFLRWYLHPKTQQFIAASRVNTARANISLTDIRNLVVPAPPVEQQARFMHEIEAILFALKMAVRRYSHVHLCGVRLLNRLSRD